MRIVTAFLVAAATLISIGASTAGAATTTEARKAYQSPAAATVVAPQRKCC